MSQASEVSDDHEVSDDACQEFGGYSEHLSRVSELPDEIFTDPYQSCDDYDWDVLDWEPTIN